MKNADTPASPITTGRGGALDLTDGTMDGWYFSQDGRVFSTGLTKREHFAAMAMQGLLSNSVMGDSALWDSPQEWVKQMTESSVEMADSLLKELSK